MHKYLLAVTAASTLIGAGVAAAQGLPSSLQPPIYGSAWTANRPSLGTSNAAGAASSEASTSEANGDSAERPPMLPSRLPPCVATDRGASRCMKAGAATPVDAPSLRPGFPPGPGVG